MGKQVAPRRWWADLDLEKETARLIAERDPETPAQLAGIARAAPGPFRQVFGEGARADLARALAAHLAKAKSDDVGYADLRDALDEVAGKRPPKPATNLPRPSLGAVSPPGPNPPVPPVPPLPKLQPRPGPRKQTKEGDAAEE